MLLMFTPALIAILISSPVIIADALNIRRKPQKGHHLDKECRDLEYMQSARNN